VRIIDPQGVHQMLGAQADDLDRIQLKRKKRKKRKKERDSHYK
jgi:hypothetical protein